MKWRQWVMRQRRDRALVGAVGVLEMLLILSIIGIILGLALPPYHQLQRKARAAHIAGDFNAIRSAAYNYFGDAKKWPRELDRGRKPPELTAYLPESFSLANADYQLDWENWELPGGVPGRPRRPTTIVGVSVYISDDLLGREIQLLLGEAVSFSTESKYTFLIQGL